MIVAGFADRDSLLHALDAMRSGDTGAPVRIETYTPEALHEDKTSRLKAVMLVAALCGGLGFFALQTYGVIWSYPIDIGGRPPFSWPAFAVNAFEAAILAAVLAGFASYLAVNRMPRLYEPEDECDALREASCDAWFLSVRGGDPARLRALLDRCAPVAMQEVPE